MKTTKITLKATLKELADIKFALDASSILAITDQTGKIIYVNDQFCRISKYSRRELMGQNHRIINSGYHSKEFFKLLWQIIARGKVWQGEIKNKAKDGRLYWVDTTIVPFLNAKGKPYQYVSIRNEITERKRMEEEIKLLPKRIIQAQEEECNRIARDLHDDLGQSLATLKLLLQSGREYKRTVEYLDMIIERSRNLAMRLRPSTLDTLGLTTAFRLMFKDIERVRKIQIKFKSSRLEELTFNSEAINLFRVIQEAMTNVIKHSKASTVDITMKYAKDNLNISVKDNGKGFDVQGQYKGLGLLTMRERVGLLGGDFQIISKINSGSRIIIDIPCRRNT